MQENQYKNLPENIAAFAYEKFSSFEDYRRAALPELKRLLGFDKMSEQVRVPFSSQSLWKREDELGSIEKIRIDLEENESACLYFCRPKVRCYKAAFICLQGHSTGMHTSIGVDWRDEKTVLPQDGDRDFAIGCMRMGILAIAFEQRYMGERSSRPDHEPSCGCLSGGAGATQALLLGRTAIGERVYDIDRLLDYLELQPEIDRDEIGIMGNSGGGTTAMFAGAILSRIKYVMPSCAFSGFRASIGSMYHCECNYIPGLLNFGESADVVGLCAPKRLVIVNGRQDKFFPMEEGTRQFKRLKEIYSDAGCAENCVRIIGDEGHRFYADIAWAAMKTWLK